MGHSLPGRSGPAPLGSFAIPPWLRLRLPILIPLTCCPFLRQTNRVAWGAVADKIAVVIPKGIL